MKAKAELTAEALKAVIEERKPTSMTQLAHHLGYQGSVSSSLTRKFRGLIPEIDSLLKGTASEGPAGAAQGGDDGKPAKDKAKTAAKPAAKPIAKAGKWPRDPRNPFREGSAYAVCFDIMAAHKGGLPKAKLLEHLGEATGKDIVHSGYNAQVLLSAHPNESGLSNNDSPRHRSCRPGFWVQRTNGHVQLMVD